MTITVRERMEVGGVLYALGAHDNDTVIIQENGEKAIYFWSDNSGKSFYLQNDAVGDDRIDLKVKWPGGARKIVKNVKNIDFFGQSPAQRRCDQLMGLLKRLGLTPEDKKEKATLSSGVLISGNLLTEFPQRIQKEFGDNIKWSPNLGTAQELVYELDCPGIEKLCVGKSYESQKDAKLKAIAQAMKFLAWE